MLKELVKGFINNLGFEITRLKKSKLNESKNKIRDIEVLPSKIKRAKYGTYDEYLDHQAKKLNEAFGLIKNSDSEYERILIDRFSKMDYGFEGKTVLCLGARLGGEVRAFKSLGAVAIGIDINPGQNNEHVLYGDFHDIRFSNNSFDYAFSNVIDHVYDIEKFSKEIYRVLKPSATLFLECMSESIRPGRYEVIDTSDLTPVLDIFKRKFKIKDEIAVHNLTSFIDWEGKVYFLTKKSSKVKIN